VRRDTYWVLLGTNWERGYLEDLVMDRRMVLKVVYGKENGKSWNGLVCFRMETHGGLLYTL
jgi:hypothetical protein